MLKRKHIPQRTCVCCRLKSDKRALLRVVSEPNRGISVDATGKKNGRGAYLCKSCRESANSARRARLEYALKTKIGEDEWMALAEALSV